MITINIQDEDDYFLPDDGDAAKKRYLDLVAMPTEGFISAYGFTLAAAFASIAELEAAGIAQSLLLDYTQGCGLSARPQIKALYPQMRHGDLVLTTAGPKSHKTRQIWHWKGMVKRAADGGAPYCMEGSTNLSISGFDQGNSMRFFRSQEWADHFIAQHNLVKEWARVTLPHYQPGMLTADRDFIDAYFDEIEVE